MVLQLFSIWLLFICLDPRANHPFNFPHFLPGIKQEFIRVSLWRKGLNKKTEVD